MFRRLGDSPPLAWREWSLATATAVSGAVLASISLAAGARPAGWVLLAAVCLTIGASGLLAKCLRRSVTQLTAFTLAAVMLSWPILFVIAYVVLVAVGLSRPGD